MWGGGGVYTKIHLLQEGCYANAMTRPCYPVSAMDVTCREGGRDEKERTRVKINTTPVFYVILCLLLCRRYIPKSLVKFFGEYFTTHFSIFISYISIYVSADICVFRSRPLSFAIRIQKFNKTDRCFSSF